MIQFSVGLVDKVSSPAAAIRASLISSAAKTKLLEGQMKSLGKEIDTLKAKQLAYREAGLGGVAAQAGLEISKLRLKMKGLSDEMKEAKGAHAAASKGLSDLAGSATEMSFAMGPATTILKAYGAALAFVVGAFIAGGALAIAAASFKKETLASFTALTGSAKVGAEALATIRSLEASVPEAESTLAERAKGLLAQGLDPKALKASLLDISNVAAVLGEQGADKITGIIEKTLTSGKFKLMPKSLVGTGVTEAALAAELHLTPAAFEKMMKLGLIGADKGLNALHAVIDKKMGGAAAEKVNTLGGLTNKLKDNLMHIFEDVKIQPFVDGLAGIVKLFDTSTSSGKTFKWIVESIFNKGFKEGGGILLGVKHLIQDIIIGGLRLYISMKPAIATFKGLWASAKKSEDLKNAVIGVAVVVGVLVGGVLLAAGVMMAFGIATVAVIAGVALGLGWVLSKIVKFGLFVAHHLGTWKQMAKDKVAGFINGLIDGITKGIGAVKKAVTKLAAILPKTLGEKLEIHSPSRVGERQGEQYPEGVAIGIEKGSGRVSSAAVGVADRAAGGGGASAGGGRGGGGGIRIDKLEINNAGVGSAGDAIELTATAIEKVLEKIALKEGLQVAIGTTSTA